MRRVLLLLSVASLAVCVAAPFLYFQGRTSMAAYKILLLAASVAYFVFVSLWVSRR